MINLSIVTFDRYILPCFGKKQGSYYFNHIPLLGEKSEEARQEILETWICEYDGIDALYANLVINKDQILNNGSIFDMEFELLISQL